MWGPQGEGELAMKFWIDYSKLLRACAGVVVMILLSAALVCASGYKTIRVGEDVSDLPKSFRTDTVFSEGQLDGSWFRISILNGKVLSFDIIYIGKSFDGTAISESLSLAEAVRIHSFQAGLQSPSFGYPVNLKGDPYGLVDTNNLIIYDDGSADLRAPVKKVSYLDSSAPVVSMARNRPVEASVMEPILQSIHSNDSSRSADGLGPTTQQGASRSGMLPAEPFGFKRGMTKAEIIAAVGSKSVDKDEGDALFLATAPNPHPDFAAYVIFVSPSTGIAKVTGTSRKFQTNSFGESIQEKFKDFATALDSSYGQAKIYDYLKVGSIWDQPQEWMMGLLKEERTLVAYWSVGDSVTIMEQAEADSMDSGYMTVAYPHD
jgi:hypothetical protein